MTKAEGFERMDVATDIHNDPKFRRIARRNPAHYAPALVAYIALLGESWREATRTTVEDAWPALLVFDPDVVQSMVAVRLVDAEGRIPMPTWSTWFERVQTRRASARERWNRANTARSQRGSSAVTANGDALLPGRSVPSFLKEGTSHARARGGGAHVREVLPEIKNRIDP